MRAHLKMHVSSHALMYCYVNFLVMALPHDPNPPQSTLRTFYDSVLILESFG